MSAPNRNTRWARTLADELARHGLIHVCAGSGSRSAPLVEAFVRDDRFYVHPHVDERSAGFFALGIATSTGLPSGVVTTSGTAAANLLPAVIEASQTNLPLIVLTADRPAILRGLDANQTIDQVGLYGGYPRLAIDLPLPRSGGTDLGHLRASAARVWAAATGAGAVAGPVHVNVQFEKPLEPVEVAGDALPEDGTRDVATEGREPGRPFTLIAGHRDGAAAGPALAASFTAARRPLIVCGPSTDPRAGRAALAFAEATSAPLIADPLSGARFGPGAGRAAVAWTDAVLATPEVQSALRPDLVLRVGPAPTSAVVDGFLSALDETDHLVLDGGGRWKDHRARATGVVRADPATALDSARAGVSPVDPGWLEAWRTAAKAAGGVLSPILAEDWFEGTIAARVAAGLPEGSTFFIGNSMPIRDVDAFAEPSDVDVKAVGFRGASGIDGNVSGALGACAGRGVPTTALIGDLTLLHDVGALLLAEVLPASLQVIVVQNRGGGIFHMLPIRDFDPPFTRHIVMPHDVSLAAVAEAAEIPHRLIESTEQLEAELRAGQKSTGIRILEAPVDREQNWARRRSALADASRAAARAIATG